MQFTELYPVVFERKEEISSFTKFITKNTHGLINIAGLKGSGKTFLGKIFVERFEFNFKNTKILKFEFNNRIYNDGFKIFFSIFKQNLQIEENEFKNSGLSEIDHFNLIIDRLISLVQKYKVLLYIDGYEDKPDTVSKELLKKLRNIENIYIILISGDVFENADLIFKLSKLSMSSVEKIISSYIEEKEFIPYFLKLYKEHGFNLNYLLEFIKAFKNFGGKFDVDFIKQYIEHFSISKNELITIKILSVLEKIDYNFARKLDEVLQRKLKLNFFNLLNNLVIKRIVEKNKSQNLFELENKLFGRMLSERITDEEFELMIYIILEIDINSNSKIDALVKVIKSTVKLRNDTIKKLIEYVEDLMNKRRDFYGYLIVDSLLHKEMDHEIKEKLKLILADLYFFLRSYESALKIYNTVDVNDSKKRLSVNLKKAFILNYLGKITEAEKIINSLLKENYTEPYLYLTYGEILFNKGMFEKAFNYFMDLEKRFKTFNESENTFLLKLYRNIAATCIELGNLSKAAKFYDKALNIAYDLNDELQITILLNNLGIVYKRLKNFDKSYDYYIKAIETAKKINNLLREAMIYNNIGSLLLSFQIYDGARINFEKSLELKKLFGDKRPIAIGYLNLGIVAIHENDLEKAEKYIDETVSILQELNDYRYLPIALIYKIICSVKYKKFQIVGDIMKELDSALLKNKNQDLKIFKKAVAAFSLFNMGYIEEALNLKNEVEKALLKIKDYEIESEIKIIFNEIDQTLSKYKSSSEE